MQQLVVQCGTVIIEDLYKLPEALAFSDVQDKVRKFIVQFFPLSHEISRKLKNANVFYAPLGLFKTIQEYPTNKEPSRFLKSLVPIAQSVDLLKSLNNLNPLTIEKIVNYIKTIDRFKLLENFNLEKNNILTNLSIVKDSCILINTAVSLRKNYSKALEYQEVTAAKVKDKDEEQKVTLLTKHSVSVLISRIADASKLAVIGLSLGALFADKCNVSVKTPFGAISGNSIRKVVNGLSYISTASGLFKSVHSVVQNRN